MQPYSTIHEGISGIQLGRRPTVELLQRALQREGFYGGPVDGAFKADTTAAVKNFQTARGLVSNGVVARETWEALPEEDLQGVPTLQEGSAGGAVALLQRCLHRLGYNPGHVNGVFGPQTAAAVREFQATGAPEVIVDGIVGSQTWPLMG